MTQATLVKVSCPLCAGTRAVHERTLRDFQLERCRGCGLVFVNPRQPPEEVLAIYNSRDPDKQADLYNQLAVPTVLAEYDETLQQLEAYLPGQGRVLDFGCGGGNFMERAVKRGWDAYGVELGVWAEKSAQTRGLKNLRTGLLTDQHFPDDFFDVVCADGVFEHLHAPRKELAEIRRILRPGGVLCIIVPNYRCLSIVLGRDDFELNMRRST